MLTNYKRRVRWPHRIINYPFFVLIVLNLIALCIGTTEFFAPISGDTSIYAYYGRQINNGMVLYKDLWDFKSPGIYYLNAFLFKIFPDSLTTLRVSVVIANLLASILLYHISTCLFSPGIAIIGSTIYLLVTNISGYFNQDGPYPETYIPLLGLAGFYFWNLYSKNTESKKYLLLAGVIGGMLIFMKQSSISFSSACLLGIIFTSPYLSKTKIQTLILFVAGAVSSLFPWLVYFYKKDAWTEFWNSVVRYPRLYAATTPFREAIRGLLSLVTSSMQAHGVMWIFTAIGLVLLVNSIKSGDNNAQKISFLLPWIVIGIIVVALPGRFYERYLMEILIPVILLCEYAINHLFLKGIPEIRVVGVVLGCFLILGVLIEQSSRMLNIIDDRILSNTLTRSEILATNPLFQDANVTVFAWGDPRIPYVTDTKSAVKWLNTEPLLTSCSYVNSSLIKELMKELNTHPPTYYIESPARPPISQSCLKGTPVADYIVKNYVFDTVIGDASIYVLQDKE